MDRRLSFMPAAPTMSGRTGGPALLSDDFPQVARGDPQFQDGGLLAFHRSDFNFFRNVDKRFRDIFNKFLHPLPPMPVRPGAPELGSSRVGLHQPCNRVGHLCAVLSPVGDLLVFRFTVAGSATGL